MQNQDSPGIFPSHDMTVIAKRLLADGEAAITVRITSAEGSTPRDTDALMLVTSERFYGTVGGGQLEWLALAEARRILSLTPDEGTEASCLDIPLGPEIGQCCGGRVGLELTRLEEDSLTRIEKSLAEANTGTVQIHGAGHVGRALAVTLALLPLSVNIIDSREGMAADLPVKGVTSALPEEHIRAAASGTAFVILTHSHDLDFLLTAEALKRGDAAYVGMIGSATKRAVFTNWLAENGYGRELAERLVCPIGGPIVKDKRPSVIAALTSAEIMTVFASKHQDM